MTTSARASSGVSPELTLRPSLSVSGPRRRRESGPGVAGANAPAFVERFPARRAPFVNPGVAGANAPAFVERTAACWATTTTACVAGANAPAFVERSEK